MANFARAVLLLALVGASYSQYASPPYSTDAPSPPAPVPTPAKVPMIIAPIPPPIIPELIKDRAVEGVLACETGSQGQLVGIRIHGESGKCESAPCDVAVGNTYIIEADFFTYASHPYLDVTLSLLLPWGLPEVPLIQNQASLKNYEKIRTKTGYTVGFPIIVPESLGLGLANVKLEASEYGIRELCGVIPLRVVE